MNSIMCLAGSASGNSGKWLWLKHLLNCRRLSVSTALTALTALPTFIGCPVKCLGTTPIGNGIGIPIGNLLGLHLSGIDGVQLTFGNDIGRLVVVGTDGIGS